MDETCFLILFHSEAGEQLARTAVESLRAFGGELSSCPVWAFVPDPDRRPHALAGIEGIQRLPLEVPEAYRGYPFAAKVYACARAEELARPEMRSLVWLSLDSLVIKPPLLLDLGWVDDHPPADAAFRPVHHQNIGSLAEEPPDAFWKALYNALGVDEMPYTVESFVDQQLLRPYFNTHSFSFNPSMGLCRTWWRHFETLLSDEVFQAGPAHDQLHRIFLHQALLSTLVAQLIPWERVRVLPSDYNYPLNLLEEMSPEQKVATLNDLVTAVYEDAFPWKQIEIREPLRSWLLARSGD